MRRPSVVLATVAVLAAAIVPAGPARAAAGYDSLYNGESAFLTLAPGTSGTFTAFFINSGSVSWTKGTSTQVDLAVCLADKVTCNASDPLEAPFNPGTWLSTTRYAAPAQNVVAPGQIATFSYAVAVPLATGQGIYRFNGDLVIAGTGERVHPEGYFHDVQVTAAAARIAVTPETGSDEIDIAQTVTITYTNASGTPVANVPVDAFVVRDASPFTSTGACSRAADALPNFSGQAACEVDTADPITDSAGKVQFTWSGSVKETHRVVAWTAPVGTVYKSTSLLTQDSATMTWVGTASTLDADPDTKTSRFSTAYTATVQVKEADGAPLAASGLRIVWQVLRGGVDAGTLCSGGTYTTVEPRTTDASGRSSFTYTGPVDPSTLLGSITTDCVFAFYDRNGDAVFESSEPSDAVKVTWSDVASGTGVTVTLTPSSLGLDSGGTQTVSVAVRDVFGDPVSGALVTLQVARVRASTSVLQALGTVLTTTLGTDTAGNAAYSYAGPGYGATDTIDACADVNKDGDCSDSGDVNYALVTDARVHWANEAAASGTANYLGLALVCDAIANRLYLYALSGPVTGNVRFSYDTGDRFSLDGTPDDALDGTARTLAVWEPKCAEGDAFVIRYTPGGSSEFENETKSP